MTEFAKVPKTQVFAGKRYTLKDSFVSKDTAERLKSRYKNKGYLVRIVQLLKRYHIYIRKN